MDKSYRSNQTLHNFAQLINNQGIMRTRRSLSKADFDFDTKPVYHPNILQRDL